MDALASESSACSSKQQGQKLKVAIIGGGICGAAIAVGLGKCSHIDFHIYEKVRGYSDVGAGLSLHKNALAAMQLIEPELLSAYRKKAVDIGEEDREMATEVILAAGRHKGLKVAELGRAKGRKSISRADLLKVFLDLIPQEKISLGKQVAKIWETHHGSERATTDAVAPNSVDSSEYDHPIHVEFTDGSRAHADVLIGCDGIHSNVRSYLLGDNHPATKPKNHDQWQVYRTLIPTDQAIQKWGIDPDLCRTVPILLGPKGHINMIPMKKGKMLSAGVAVRGAARSNSVIGPYSKPASPPNSSPTLPPAPPPTPPFDGQGGVVPWVWLASLQNTTVGDLFAGTNRTISSDPAGSSEGPPPYHRYPPQPPNSPELLGAPLLDPYSYKDYTSEARKIVLMVTNDTSSSWAVADHDHAPYYVRRCVAMAGDAAHAALPFAGNGAAQALEDAAVLTCLLKIAFTVEQAGLALHIYQLVRKVRSQMAVEAARDYGRVYSFAPINIGGAWVCLHENPELMMKWFRDQAAFTNEYDVAKQCERAEKAYTCTLKERKRKRDMRVKAEKLDQFLAATQTGTTQHPETRTDAVKNEGVVGSAPTMGEGTSPRADWEPLKPPRGSGGKEGEKVPERRTAKSVIKVETVKVKEVVVNEADDGERVERDEANDSGDDVESVKSVEDDRDSEYDFVDDYLDDADDELDDGIDDGSDL